MARHFTEMANQNQLWLAIVAMQLLALILNSAMYMYIAHTCTCSVPITHSCANNIHIFITCSCTSSERHQSLMTLMISSK